MPPQVSVILGVYNAGDFLRPAIESILNQTFADFEFIIINDGSSDGSDAVIRSYADTRIRYFNQPNAGSRQTLNTAIGLAQGTYIARMDHDDISLPERLQQQVTFLEQHRDHILVGTTYAYIDIHNQITGIFPALLDDDIIKRELLTKSPFAHGSVMMRRSVLIEHNIRYRATHTDDYDLWFQLSTHGKFANLPHILFYWRRTPDSMTNLHSHHQQNDSRDLQDAAIATTPMRTLTQWPGWKTIHRYRNEHITLQERSWTVARRNSHSSMYLNLAARLWRHKHRVPALVCAWFAFLVQPIYPFQVIVRQLKRQS
jgi:glycosyltransferase involved in cell wall biosynthesis